ncbi:15446_t:CDS:1, partial [Entrophospora sp. SA101]
PYLWQLTPSLTSQFLFGKFAGLPEKDFVVGEWFPGFGFVL